MKLAKSYRAMSRSSGILTAMKKIDEATMNSRADCGPGSRCAQ